MKNYFYYIFCILFAVWEGVLYALKMAFFVCYVSMNAYFYISPLCIAATGLSVLIGGGKMFDFISFIILFFVILLLKYPLSILAEKILGW